MRARYRALAPAHGAAYASAEHRKRQAVKDRSRAAEMYVSGRMDLAWFDAQDARLAAIERDADTLLARLPEPPDTDAIDAAWQRLRDVRDLLPAIVGEDRGRVLHELGIVVVGPAGYRSGRGDAGKVTIRVHTQWRGFFPDECG